MSIIKKLAGQTAIYGLSSIVGRFLNYLLVPLYTRIFFPEEYGIVAEMYAYAGFFLVVFIYGMETAYFRFAKSPESEKKVFTTALYTIIGSSAIFTGALVLFSSEIAALIRFPDQEEYVIWFALIFGLDAITMIPFARLRQQDKAGWYATVKVINITINIGLNLFFLLLCPYLLFHPEYEWTYAFIDLVYNAHIGVGYVFIANLAASIVTLALLLPLFFKEKGEYDRTLLKPMLAFAVPLALVGFAGIINEMLDRILLKFLLPYDQNTVQAQIGIYSACYKLSILMTLFVQAFRLAAEPFFFAQAANKNAKTQYAFVMKYFVIIGCIIFLVILFYLGLFKHFIGEDYYSGLKIVPMLLLANLFLGIYYNLSIWYKLTDKTYLGALISIGGAIITVLLNIWWIPYWGYVGSAWATLVCYITMAGASFLLGRKFYKIDYPLGKIALYLSTAILLYVLSEVIETYVTQYGTAWIYLINSSLLILFIAGAWLRERPMQKLKT